MWIDPAALDLGQLFQRPEMFTSRSSWAAAGFDVLARSNEKKIMVARHALVPGLIFKKYGPALALDDQRKNYAARVEGAERLRDFVRSHDLRSVVVPNKQILALPSTFSREGQVSQLLVVERIDLVGVEESEKAYYWIDPAILRELCCVLSRFRGLDSIVDNVPFTSDGRLAFVDTENWDRGRRRTYLRYIRRHLSSEGRTYARKLFSQLCRLGSDGKGRDEPDDSSSSSSSSWSS